VTKDRKLTEEELQKLLLVRRVVISPFIGQELEEEDEASEGSDSGRVKTPVKDSQVHKAQGS
jgi:hypothetical protein